MNAAVLALLTLAIFGLAYRFYSRFLAERIFQLRPDEPVPSVELRDDIDYIPTPKAVLWGHHYTSIAGAAPIVGPALAVIWGWVPALVWVVLGTIAMGATHDFGSMVISLRHRGRSMGEISGEVISPRVRILFLLIISFLIWIVLAVFAFIIGKLFVSNPGAIFPINVQIIVALVLGALVYRAKVKIFLPSLVAFALLLTAVFYGNAFAAAFPIITTLSVTQWVWILLVYAFVASVLPVWMLLQPRDYLNSHQLIVGLGLLMLGLLVLRPEVVAPAFNLHPIGAPPMLPFLFITIACGAISGFHGLVSSGTTSKQVACMTDARPIGYGAMLGEGSLGMLAVLASTAGFTTHAEWATHYASWSEASGLGPKLDAFVSGGASFIAALGIPLETGKTFIAVMVIAFAATSLDTGARIQRLVIEELADSYGFKPLTNRYLAGALGIGLALLLAITQGNGQGGLILWPLFGTTNQLVAGVTLLILSVWLAKLNRPNWPTLLPMLLVATVTFVAMLHNLWGYIQGANWLLTAIGGAVLILDAWVLLEGLAVLRTLRASRAAG